MKLFVGAKASRIGRQPQRDAEQDRGAEQEDHILNASTSRFKARRKGRVRRGTAGLIRGRVRRRRQGFRRAVVCGIRHQPSSPWARANASFPDAMITPLASTELSEATNSLSRTLRTTSARGWK